MGSPPRRFAGSTAAGAAQAILGAVLLLLDTVAALAVVSLLAGVRLLRSWELLCAGVARSRCGSPCRQPHQQGDLARWPGVTRVLPAPEQASRVILWATTRST